MDVKFQSALQAVCVGEDPGVIVTVIGVKGSTPRKPGAKMLILPDGQTFGTIGGGCGEAEVRQEALGVFAGRESFVYKVNMTGDMAAEEGMACGGIMEVFIDPVKTPEDKALLRDYCQALASGVLPVLVTVVDSSDSRLCKPGSKLFVGAAGNVLGSIGNSRLDNAAVELAGQGGLTGKAFTSRIEEPNLSVVLCVEPSPAAVELVILGGGHIALPLAVMAKILGYKVTVADDRPSFANKARFPGADRVICADFQRSISQIDFGPNCFVVIVTRGHRHDKICLSEVIGRQTAYIGMIGSRRRIKVLLNELKTEGVAGELLERVYSPIGLDLGAETPEEIAVSILAELIKVHRGGRAESLRHSEFSVQK